MKRFLNKIWTEDDGVLTFEWVLLITVLVIGIVGGLAAARDAIIDELGDVAEATINFNQSYFIAWTTVLDGNGQPVLVLPEQQFTDTPAQYTDRGCATGVSGALARFGQRRRRRRLIVSLNMRLLVCQATASHTRPPSTP